METAKFAPNYNTTNGGNVVSSPKINKKRLLNKKTLMHLFSNVENLPSAGIREGLQMNYSLNPLYLFTNKDSYMPKIVPNPGQSPSNLQSTNYKDLQTDIKNQIENSPLIKENFQMNYSINPLYLFTNKDSYTPKIVPNHGQSPSDLQSTNFKDLQTNIKKKINHKELFKENFNNNEGKTGNNDFSNNLNLNLNPTNYVEETKHVLRKTTPSLSQVNAHKSLLLNYNILLEDYQNLLQKTQDLIKNYTNSLNPKINPYLGKNIKFPNGNIAYVTKLGVVKPYPNGVFEMNAGKNGCPVNTPIAINIPWSNSFLTPKTVILERPYLIAGTQMVPGQSCGNEGSNILISSLFGTVEPTLSYLGCYKDSFSSPVMDYLTPINSFDPSSNQIYSFEDCQISARMNGYNYFGLQNVNQTTFKGICSLSNDLNTATSLGISKTSNQKENCNNLFNSELIGGGPNANAIYNISPVADKSQLNNIYYVNPNSEIFSYPEKDIELSTNYTMFHNFDSSYNNISTMKISDLNSCETACNQDKSCAGFVFDKKDQTCYTKTNNMWPYGSKNIIPKDHTDLYLKNSALTQAPYHISTSTTNVDSITASNYKKETMKMNEVDPNQLLVPEKINIYTNMKEIELLENKITLLAQKLSMDNVYMGDKNEILYYQSLKDKDVLNRMLDEYNNLISMKEVNSSIGILNDTNVVITQKNYSYIMWSMFAVGLILITFSVLNKK